MTLPIARAPRTLIRLTIGLVVWMALAAGTWSDASDEHSRLPGLWFGDLDVTPGAPINQSQIFLNIDARGTLTTADTDDLTGLNPDLSALEFTVNSPGHGVWKRTGRKTFAMDYYFFEYVGTGPSAGLLADLVRIRCRVDVDRNELDGSCDADFYFAEDPDGDGIPNSPDPTVDAPGFVFADLWEVHARRVRVAD